MLKIGLSGNRYSGKDRVAKIFKQIGVPVFEADIILKFIINHNYEIQSKIADKIGRGYFTNSSLNLDKIVSDSVFSSIIEEVEIELYNSWKKFLDKNYKSIYCIFHSSILFESKWNQGMDKNIVVFAPYSDRVERCKYLTNKSISSIYSISKSEMDDLKKNELSDYIIHNYNQDGPFGDALTQVNKIDKKIIDSFLKGEMKKEIVL